MQAQITAEFSYPFAPIATTTDNYFGRLVTDAYRWLEDLDHPTITAWIEGQIDCATNFFAPQSQLHAKVKNRLTTLRGYPKYSVLAKEGQNYFFWGLDIANQPKLQNQAVLYRQESLISPPQVLLDPTQIDPEGRVAITHQAFSHDGTLLAYAMTREGGDWQEVKIRHALTGQDYPETLTGCKAANFAWKADNSGFYYNRFVASAEGQIDQSYIFWHKIGTLQSQDELIYGGQDDKELSYYPVISSDGDYLILYVCRGTEPNNRVYYRAVAANSPFVKLLDDGDAQYVFVGNRGTTFYFQTDRHAPRGRIIAVNLAYPQPVFWHTVVVEQTESLAFVVMAGGRLVAGYLHHAHHRLKLYWLDGTFEREIALPGFCSITGIAGKPDANELFISLEGYTQPVSVLRYNFQTSQLSTVVKPAFDFQFDDYITQQVFFPSKDGTPVPMFITHQKDLKLDGTNPTLLTAYGGFGISMTPLFSISQALWLAQGGVLAVANIRGGGEYGAGWHQAGRLAYKQNSFDDFCAAASWLAANNYTNRARLAISGHSNGGLLVAACAVQRPELFGAVICQAPLTDMLRYHKFGSGYNWLPEYGKAEASRQEFEFLYAYSPLHNIKVASYPAMLITVPLADERVHPMHALKFAAALQAHASKQNPILLRIEQQSGHGLGNPVDQVIAEISDIYTFLFTIFAIPI